MSKLRLKSNAIALAKEINHSIKPGKKPTLAEIVKESQAARHSS
ncbi:MAG TPA: hypothetical protein VIR29_08130 [Anseongella sp.]